MKVQIPERKATILQAPHGVIYKRAQKARTWNIPNDRKKRGKITIFSRHSAKRLREKLVMLPSQSNIYGVTMTFKKEAFFDSVGYDGLREWWNRFQMALRSRVKQGVLSKNLICVWRIELQLNGTPHFHCVLSCDKELDLLVFRQMFFDHVLKYFGYGCPDNAFDMRDLATSDEAYSYLCSHTSKHKKSQLGWLGRQWGIFFGSSLAKAKYNESLKEIETCSHNDKLCVCDEVKLKRVIRALWWSKTRERIFSKEERKEIFEIAKTYHGKARDDFIKRTRKNAPRYYSMDRFKSCRKSIHLLGKRQSAVSSQFMGADTKVKLFDYVKVVTDEHSDVEGTYNNASRSEASVQRTVCK